MPNDRPRPSRTPRPVVRPPAEQDALDEDEAEAGRRFHDARARTMADGVRREVRIQVKPGGRTYVSVLHVESGAE